MPIPYTPQSQKSPRTIGSYVQPDGEADHTPQKTLCVGRGGQPLTHLLHTLHANSRRMLLTPLAPITSIPQGFGLRAGSYPMPVVKCKHHPTLHPYTLTLLHGLHFYIFTPLHIVLPVILHTVLLSTICSRCQRGRNIFKMRHRIWVRNIHDASGAGIFKMRRETFRNIQGAVRHAHDTSGAGTFKMRRNIHDASRAGIFKLRCRLGASGIFKMRRENSGCQWGENI